MGRRGGFIEVCDDECRPRHHTRGVSSSEVAVLLLLHEGGSDDGRTPHWDQEHPLCALTQPIWKGGIEGPDGARDRASEGEGYVHITPPFIVIPKRDRVRSSARSGRCRRDSWVLWSPCPVRQVGARGQHLLQQIVHHLFHLLRESYRVDASHGGGRASQRQVVLRPADISYKHRVCRRGATGTSGGMCAECLRSVAGPLPRTL